MNLCLAFLTQSLNPHNSCGIKDRVKQKTIKKYQVTFISKNTNANNYHLLSEFIMYTLWQFVTLM